MGRRQLPSAYTPKGGHVTEGVLPLLTSCKRALASAAFGLSLALVSSQTYCYPVVNERIERVVAVSWYTLNSSL